MGSHQITHIKRTHKRGKERETNPWSWSCATTPKRVQGNRLLLPQSLPLWIAKVCFDPIMFMVLREIHDVRRSCFIYIQLCILEYMMINNIQHVVSEHG